MITSMTGYGRSEVTKKGKTIVAEIRSVNSRYFELTTKLPKSQLHHENDVREIIQEKLQRGKINVAVYQNEIENISNGLKINKTAAREYYRLLNELKNSLKLREQVSLNHLLHFSDILEAEGKEVEDETEWKLCEKVISEALANLIKMRNNEGIELQKDLTKRIKLIEKKISYIEKLSKGRIPKEREKIRDKVKGLLNGLDKDGLKRIEMEIILLADKLDITEECVRLRSHCKFFNEAILDKEPSGRKLNFLIQEINREANTIGAKANDAKISHIIIKVKEELEKIREQLQNIE